MNSNESTANFDMNAANEKLQAYLTSDSTGADKWLDSQFANAQTSIYRDLAMNLKKILSESPLEPMDRVLNLLAAAQTVDFDQLTQFAEKALMEAQVPSDWIVEAKQSTAIMGMLNTYYKFKTYLADEAKEIYQRAGLRMQSLMKPATGKHRFEMMALTVSIVNGCPSCVASHERALAQLNTQAEQIHDLARLASVVKGLSALAKTM